MFMTRRSLLGATAIGLTFAAAGCNRATGGPTEFHAILDRVAREVLHEIRNSPPRFR